MRLTTQGYAGLKQTLRGLQARKYAGSRVVRRVRRVAAHIYAYLSKLALTYLTLSLCCFFLVIRGFNPAYPAYPSRRVINKGFADTQGLFQPCATLRKVKNEQAAR
jgi:hypothetical protein